MTCFEDNWENIKKFYTSYSHLSDVRTDELSQADISGKIESELDGFITMREKKKQDAANHSRIADILMKQRQENEEEKSLLAKKLADEAAVAEVEKKDLKSPINNFL